MDESTVNEQQAREIQDSFLKELQRIKTEFETKLNNLVEDSRQKRIDEIKAKLGM